MKTVYCANCKFRSWLICKNAKLYETIGYFEKRRLRLLLQALKFNFPNNFRLWLLQSRLLTKFVRPVLGEIHWSGGLPVGIFELVAFVWCHIEFTDICLIVFAIARRIVGVTSFVIFRDRWIIVIWTTKITINIIMAIVEAVIVKFYRFQRDRFEIYAIQFAKIGRMAAVAAVLIMRCDIITKCQKSKLRMRCFV